MNKIQILLLKLIKHNGNISAIAEHGFEYVQISEMLKSEIEKGNALVKDGKIQLSERGELVLFEHIKISGRKNSDIWIEPESSSQIEALKIDEIYVPHKFDLWYLE